MSQILGGFNQLVTVAMKTSHRSRGTAVPLEPRRRWPINGLPGLHHATVDDGDGKRAPPARALQQSLVRSCSAARSRDFRTNHLSVNADAQRQRGARWAAIPAL